MNKENHNEKRTSRLDTILARIDPAESAKNEDRMRIAANIDDLLRERNWSKKYFAEQLSKEPSVISKWLSGTCNFTTETLTEIRLLFKVSLSDLTREKPPELTFRAALSAVGVWQGVDQRPFGYSAPGVLPDLSGYHGYPKLSVSAEEAGHLSDHLAMMATAVTTGMLTLHTKNPLEWKSLGSTMLSGNMTVLHPVKKQKDTRNKDEAAANNYALKA